MNSLLECKNVSFSYNEIKILRDVSFSLNPKEFIGIIGPNGAGKSTLLRIMARIIKPDSGEVIIKNRPLESYSFRDYARLSAMVQQDTSITFPYRVDSFILMGRHPYLNSLQIEGSEDYAILDDLLDQFDISMFRDRVMTELSGGEKQRVIIAGALAQQPEILLLDEPTTALDLEHQLQIYKLIRRQIKGELSVVAVTHDINLAAEYCSRLILLHNGRIVRQGAPEDVITRENLRDFYNVEAEIINHPVRNVPFVIPLKELNR